MLSIMPAYLKMHFTNQDKNVGIFSFWAGKLSLAGVTTRSEKYIMKRSQLDVKQA